MRLSKPTPSTLPTTLNGARVVVSCLLQAWDADRTAPNGRRHHASEWMRVLSSMP